MILIWTKSDKIGSHLIRYGLEEEMSHFATAFFASDKKGLVIHQNLIGGFRIDWAPQFLKTNEVVRELSPKNITRHDSRSILHGMMNEFSGTNYDEPGFMYFTWRIFLRRYFNTPLPNVNKWGDGTDPLCTGHARVIHKMRPEWFTKEVNDFDIMTPGALYENMWNSGQFEITSVLGGKK